MFRTYLLCICFFLTKEHKPKMKINIKYFTICTYLWSSYRLDCSRNKRQFSNQNCQMLSMKIWFLTIYVFFSQPCSKTLCRNKAHLSFNWGCRRGWARFGTSKNFEYYNLTKFRQNRIKNKRFLLLGHFL